AAASSNPNVSTTDNFVFSSSYRSVDWYGELIRQRIVTTGASTSLTAQNWSAMRLLDCATTSWKANTSYVAGAVFQHGTNCYVVNAPAVANVQYTYTSGATFDGSSNGVDALNTTLMSVDETATPLVGITPLAARNIYTKNDGANSLINFNWSSLSSAQKAYFTAPAITYVSSTVGLSQFCTSGGTCLSNTLQSNTTIASGGAAGEALVNFLRGDRTNEGTYFRNRTHVLGDIVSSEGRYVAQPLFNYLDANYDAFKTAKASRAGAVYVGSNYGMLHSFDATTGQENWGYIPSFVLPNLYKLADLNYASQHQYFVDASPETGDICPNAPSTTCSASQWKTIIVGGLNRGGKGYYALDITDPATPLLLWEFTDANLGYSYGNPTITKLSNGTWVVLVSSGYNNADGLGHLYVLNANTGAVISDIVTSAGSPTTPSGLARISGYTISPETNNTTVSAYGGDMLGNLWGFDINGNLGTGPSSISAYKIATFKDPGGITTQPVTVMPVMTNITVSGATLPIVYVGTGRFLGVSDESTTQTQSFYAVKDKMDKTTIYSPRLVASAFVAQTLTSGTCPSGSPSSVCIPGQTVVTSSNNTVDWTSKNGWYVDFINSGERSVTDPTLALGTLFFTTITPASNSGDACGTTGSGNSFLYALNYLTGGSVSSTGVSGANLGSGIATRPIVVELSDGSLKTLIRMSGSQPTSSSPPVTQGGTDVGNTGYLNPTAGTDNGTTAFGNATGNNPHGTPRRVSWRELPSN
ncbi:MAG: pilus assembly protein, partial [Burkholderiaceae bacterium]